MSELIKLTVWFAFNTFFSFSVKKTEKSSKSEIITKINSDGKLFPVLILNIVYLAV